MILHRWLLHLFPRSFRDEYGVEMGEIAELRLREAGGAGRRLAVWVDIYADMIVSATGVQWDVARQDLRFSARSLWRAPGFAVAAVMVVALGVGATTAVFSVADHVLVRPLPFSESDRLVNIWQDQTAAGYSRMELSPGNFRDWSAMSSTLDELAAHVAISANLITEGQPERVNGVLVTSNLFRVLQAGPKIGRVFDSADDQAGVEPTAVISHSLWQRRFGGATGALGRTIALDGEVRRIIGIMPPGFIFPSRDVEFWTLLRFAPDDYADRGNNYLRVIARLPADSTIEAVRADLRAVTADLERQFPEANADTSAAVVHLREEVGEQSRLLLTALIGASLCLLVIACANLASLLLTRALARRRELAVRAAIGAGRERLVRQMLTESLVVAGLGGALGTGLAVLVVPLLARLVPTVLPIAAAPAVSLRMLGLAGVATLLTGIAFGVVPALRASRSTGADSLRSGARAGTSPTTERLRSALVAAEVAASLVLLVVSGLLIQAMWSVQRTDPGFEVDGVLTLRTAPQMPDYGETVRRAVFYREVLDGVRALPGVSDAAYISFLPMVMRGGVWPVGLPGRDTTGLPDRASLRYVTPGFFNTLSIPLRAGRDVSERDTRQAESIAVVSESFVKAHWPDQDPIGRRFEFAFEARTVVGVVGDVRVRGLERASEPQVYLSYQQVGDGAIPFYVPKDLAVKVEGDPEALGPAIRAVVARANPLQPVSDMQLLSDIVSSESAGRRVQVQVLWTFASAACLLAAVGIHGLLAFTVSSQRRELGVRLALGAGRLSIVALVGRRAGRLALVGTVAGLVVAAWAGRLLESLLAGVSPSDPLTLAGAVLLVVLATLAGSLLPAIGASRVDPLTAIRQEG